MPRHRAMEPEPCERCGHWAEYPVGTAEVSRDGLSRQEYRLCVYCLQLRATDFKAFLRGFKGK